MRAGPLRERITFQTVTRIADNYGGYTEAWSDTLTVHARMKPIQADETLQQEQVKQETRFECTVRYKSTINANMRIVWNSTNYRILSVINPDEKRKWLKLSVTYE